MPLKSSPAFSARDPAPKAPAGSFDRAAAERGKALFSAKATCARCHVPPLHLRAVVRDATGTVAYRGPAMAREYLAGNYAGEGVAHARLLAPCGDVTVSGSGLSATGTIRCP